MSNISNSPSLDDGNLKDASTSIEDLPIRITSTATSAVTVLNIFGRNNSVYFTRHNNTPVKEDSNSSSAASRAAKSLKQMKFGTRYPQLPLDVPDFGKSDSSDTSLCASNTCKTIYKSSMEKKSRKPRCKTNVFKALKSFEKNNLCTSNRKAGRYVLDKVKHATKPSINQKVNQPTKSLISEKVNQLPDPKNIRKLFTDANLQNLRSVKKSKTTVNVAFTTCKALDESKITTLIDETNSVVPKSNLSSLECNSNQGICSSSSLPLLDNDLNAQERFKLKVRKATTKMEYLSRNCKFLHLKEPEMKKPLLILDFDSLMIPFALPSEDLSKHKLEISRLIHTMYSHFNIAIWSASTMKILVSRLKDLDIFDEAKITKIIFCLDCTSTTTAFVPGLGNTIVKSPEVIWNLYPQFNKKNTIMINEDMKKFVFKQYGVPVGAQEDQKLIKYFELVTISNFLANLITSTRSFSNLNIQSWKTPWN